MGNFLRAAYLVLTDAKRPLSPREIVEEAQKRGVLTTSGLTPHQTMKSKLSTDILRHRSRSQFMRAEAGKFTIREQGGEAREHIAPRFKKALFDEDIVVFEARLLPKYFTGVGLNTRNLDTRSLLAECFPMRRRLAEEDFSVIQLVSFYIVTFGGKYLTYKRTKRLPESRLHGFYSIGFGGHLNPDDIPSLFNYANPDEALSFIVRELREELILSQSPQITFRGLLFDDSRQISKQHIGLVYDVALLSPEFRIGERGFLMDPKFESIEEICARIDEFENWSVLVAREEHRRDLEISSGPLFQ